MAVLFEGASPHDTTAFYAKESRFGYRLLFQVCGALEGCRCHLTTGLSLTYTIHTIPVSRVSTPSPVCLVPSSGRPEGVVTCACFGTLWREHAMRKERTVLQHVCPCVLDVFVGFAWNVFLAIGDVGPSGQSRYLLDRIGHSAILAFDEEKLSRLHRLHTSGGFSGVGVRQSLSTQPRTRLWPWQIGNRKAKRSGAGCC